MGQRQTVETHTSRHRTQCLIRVSTVCLPNDQRGTLHSEGAQWLSGRVLDSRPRGRGFEPHRRHCVVSLRKNINPSLVLIQPRKTRPFITERLLMGRKESIQTNKHCIRFNYLGLRSACAPAEPDQCLCHSLYTKLYKLSTCRLAI